MHDEIAGDARAALHRLSILYLREFLMTREVVVLSAVRSAIGAFGGSLATMCIGGGQGIAVVFERMD